MDYLFPGKLPAELNVGEFQLAARFLTSLWIQAVFMSQHLILFMQLT